MKFVEVFKPSKQDPYAAVDMALGVFTEAKTKLEAATAMLVEEENDLADEVSALLAQADQARQARARAEVVAGNIAALLG